jgi:hypothetical protein
VVFVWVANRVGSRGELRFAIWYLEMGVFKGSNKVQEDGLQQG